MSDQLVSQLKFKLTRLGKSVGSIIRQDGEIDDNINHRSKMSGVSGVTLLGFFVIRNHLIR